MKLFVNIATLSLPNSRNINSLISLFVMVRMTLKQKMVLNIHERQLLNGLKLKLKMEMEVEEESIRLNGLGRRWSR